MIFLLHTANSAHFHPDQLAVAAVISVLIVGGSWVLERRRS
jgi:hypothetical protein